MSGRDLQCPPWEYSPEKNQSKRELSPQPQQSHSPAKRQKIVSTDDTVTLASSHPSNDGDTGKAKREQFSIEEQSRGYVKRQKFESAAETVTISLEKSRQCSSASSREFKLSECSSYRSESRQSYTRKTVNSGREVGYFDRRWSHSSRDFSNCNDKIVVVSYNILGVKNAENHSFMYRNVPRKNMQWEGRSKLMCKEISHYNPSVLCFQEVDKFDDLKHLLKKDGFRGVYKARTGEACDGCAIFWKDKRFTLLHQEDIEFQEFDLRENVAQLCVLKMKQKKSNTGIDTQTLVPSPYRSIVVGNIHVLFNPKRGDIKLGQVRLYLEKAHKLSQEWGSIPIILSGDMNCLPQSPMYQFLASAELDIQLHGRRNISGQESSRPYGTLGFQNQNLARCVMSISKSMINTWTDDEIKLATGKTGATATTTRLQHQLKLCSVYTGIPGNNTTRDKLGEPLATSCASHCIATVDYIWHTPELVPVKVLETLPINIIRRIGGFPNEKWGSDHLALVCELAFVDSLDQQTQASSNTLSDHDTIVGE